MKVLTQSKRNNFGKKNSPKNSSKNKPSPSPKINKNSNTIKNVKNKPSTKNDKLSSKKPEFTPTTVTAAKSSSKFDDVFRMELLKNWNLARNIKLGPGEKKKHLDQLFELIQGKIPEILFKHDTSRIIQTCLKYGSKEQRAVIAKELEGRFVEASNPEFKDKIVLEFKGSVTKLIQHRFAHDVILELYECLNAKQRNSLIHEFYGPEFNLFKEAENKSMSELINEDPSNKIKILKNLSSTIEKMLKKPGLIGHIISHRILLDYFTCADDTNDNQVQEKIQIIGKHIPEILHTQKGSRVAMYCLAHGTVKVTMKEYVGKIACEEYGYLVLLRAFDVVDDTIIVSKYVIEKIIKSDDIFKQIMENKWGHRVILYLLVGRSKIYFSHETLKLLGEGDEIRKITSKKDPIIRANELCKHISPALINYSKHNTDKMLSNPYATQILCETLLHAIASIEEKQQIFENIAKIASKPPPNIDSFGEADNDDHIMLSYVNRTLKVLVQGQHWRINKSQECSEKTNSNFASILFNEIKDYISVYARHPSASYVILALLKDSKVGSEVKNILKKNLENFRSSASGDKNSGTRLILTELNELQIEDIGNNKDKSNESKSMNKGKKRKKND
ncbi:13837_t:CDS:2 [Entrophospora sp. SA101]|nr:14394_t:CDS:2 [Entrophospora sp. SA101]CAJ0856039.1 13837_t:CDS:2 [Entrophospora sp. SA101]